MHLSMSISVPLPLWDSAEFVEDDANTVNQSTTVAVEQKSHEKDTMKAITAKRSIGGCEQRVKDGEIVENGNRGSSQSPGEKSAHHRGGKIFQVHQLLRIM